MLHFPRLSAFGGGQRKLIVFLIVLLLVGLEFSVVPYLVDSEAIKTEFTVSFKRLTGLDADIQGDAVVKPLPYPHVVINSISVHNISGAANPFFITIRLVDIRLSMLSLLRGKLSIDSMNIDGVNIELEHLANGDYNWKDNSLYAAPTQEASQGKSSPHSSLAQGAAFKAPKVVITNASIHYVDTLLHADNTYDHIDFTIINGGSSKPSNVTLGMMYGERQIDVSGHIDNISQALETGHSSADLTLKSGKTSLEYKGNIGLENKNYALGGDVSFDTDDIVPWFELVSGDSAKKINQVSYAPLPLTCKSRVTSDEHTIGLPDITLSGAAIKGTASFTINDKLQAAFKATLASANLENIFASQLFDSKTLTEQETKEKIATYSPPRSLMDDVNLSVQVKIADAVYNEQHLKNARVDLDMIGGEMSVSQAFALLPGNARIVFTGLGKEGYQGFSLEGQIDAVGDDFYQTIKVFKSKGITFPPEDFKRFRIRTNATLSSHEMRLSEITARIENTALIGGIIANFGDRTKFEAAVQVGGMNFDHFANLWGLPEWRKKFFDTSLGSEKDDSLLRWLNQFGYDLDIKASLDQFVLGGKPRGRTFLKINATAGEILLSDIDTTYNGTHLAGNVSINVRSKLPHIDISVGADTLDMATFFDNPDFASTPSQAQSGGNASAKSRPRWSHDAIDFHWMELLNVSFYGKFGHFTYKNFSTDNLSVRGAIENNALDMDILQMNTLGASIAGKIGLTGERIPRASAAFNILGLSMDKLVGYTPVFEPMLGKYNVSLRLATSGTDMASWIANLEGTAGIGGRNILIKDFNLPGIIRAVSYVRTVADILNVVKRAFPGGDTLFSRIEGQLAISDGILKLPNLKLYNVESNAVAYADVDLINWRLQGNVTFSLTSLDRNTPPTVTINFSGNVDTPDLALDTRSLEQYVTNKTSQKMLQQYGTH